jgi:hypothetical protein
MAARAGDRPRRPAPWGWRSRTGFADASFDLVHVRFMFAPLGRAEALCSRDPSHRAAGRRRRHPGAGCIGLAVLASSTAFQALVERLSTGFANAGGDFNDGPHSRCNACSSTGTRTPPCAAKCCTLRGGHPYARLPLLFAESFAARLERRAGATPAAGAQDRMRKGVREFRTR